MNLLRLCLEQISRMIPLHFLFTFPTFEKETCRLRSFHHTLEDREVTFQYYYLHNRRSPPSPYLICPKIKKGPSMQAKSHASPKSQILKFRVSHGFCPSDLTKVRNEWHPNLLKQEVSTPPWRLCTCFEAMTFPGGSSAFQDFGRQTIAG